jgi:hypothetical protein
MHITISFVDQEPYDRQAARQRVQHSMSALRLLMAMLFILLAVLLAVWVAGPRDAVVASGFSKETDVPVLAADSTQPAAVPVENRSPDPEAWYEDTSPYAHEPLVISSGGGSMNLPK